MSLVLGGDAWDDLTTPLMLNIGMCGLVDLMHAVN